jgi:hypothetical protein
LDHPGKESSQRFFLLEKSPMIRREDLGISKIAISLVCSLAVIIDIRRLALVEKAFPIIVKAH